MVRIPIRVRWFVLAIVFTGTIFWSVVIYLFSPPEKLPSGHFAPRFRIAKDTTHILHPIDSEGYPDYEEAINLHFSKGVKAEENRLVGFLNVFGPKSVAFDSAHSRFYKWLGRPQPPDQGDYLILLEDYLKKIDHLEENKRIMIAYKWRKNCEDHPWKEKDFPQMAAWVERNRGPIKSVIDASLLAQYFYPSIDAGKNGELEGLRSISQLLIFGLEDLISLLSCRAMLEAGREDYNAAKEMLLAALRLIYSFRPKFTGDLRVLNQMEQKIYSRLHVLVESARFSTIEIESLQSAVDAVGAFPSVSELLDFGDRLVMLQKVLLANKIGLEYLDYLIDIAHPLVSDDAYAERIRGISRYSDYNINLIAVNECVDKLVDALRVNDPLVRSGKMNSIREYYKKMDDLATDIIAGPSDLWLSAPFSWRFSASTIGLRVISLSIFDPIIAQQVADETEEKRRLFFTSLALARFHRDTGKYPETLEELVSKYLKVIPLDIFSGRVPRYERTPQGGYQMYSIGVDRTDSGGHAKNAAEFSDDIVFKVTLPSQR